MTSSEQSGIWFSRSAGSPYGGHRLPGSKIRVLIVDDHALYRKGLRAIISLESDMETVGEASDGTEAIEQVNALKPDIVLMDINMPGMDGMEATRRLTDLYPGILIITLTMFQGEEHLREARRAGSSAYVLKDAGADVLLRTIREVVSGETPLLQRDNAYVTGPMAPSSEEPVKQRRSGTDMLITSNERRILKLLAEDRSNDEIAREMGMAESMIRTYLAEIYRKLGLSGREAAAQFARKRGMANTNTSGDQGTEQG